MLLVYGHRTTGRGVLRFDDGGVARWATSSGAGDEEGDEDDDDQDENGDDGNKGMVQH